MRIPTLSRTAIGPAIAAFAVLSLAASSLPVRAHSLNEIEAELGDREKFFQAVDRPAPDFELKDAEGRVVALRDVRGKVVVLHFIYTHCPDFCPLHAEAIAEVQGLVNETPMGDLVRFVTITADPERDTPEIMRDYGPTHGLEPANWTFLTSGPDRPDDTRRLAESFGHRFTPTDDGMQMHGVVTHVIDREGRLRGNFHGLRFARVNLLMFINALTNDHHGPDAPQSRSLWDRIIQWF